MGQRLDREKQEEKEEEEQNNLLAENEPQSLTITSSSNQVNLQTKFNLSV